MSKQIKIAVIGGGMGGLVLALALNKHANVKATVFEQAKSFDSNAGGAIGLYANGLRVLRDISPELLQEIKRVSFPYLQRRWLRQDGSEVAVAQEEVLLKYCSLEDKEELQSVGIRRWKFQKVLVDFCVSVGVEILFGKRFNGIVQQKQPILDDESCAGPFNLQFEDGSVHEGYDLLFGADGIRSKTRELLFGQTDPEYSGTTCLMGAAAIPRPVRGICLLSAATSNCHACIYPTGDEEQVFQIYYPEEEKPETWGSLSAEDAKVECQKLAERLANDGWHNQFTEPILHASNVIRVGLRHRSPLPVWARGRIVLLGDAAHPPLPYIGQGAMMAIEDAGILSMLIKNFCGEAQSTFDLSQYGKVTSMYQTIRIPRTTRILSFSKNLGSMQQSRTKSTWLRLRHEFMIWWQVKLNGTLPVMFDGATYNYAEDLKLYFQENM